MKSAPVKTLLWTAIFAAAVACAQQPPQAPEGTNYGNYNVRQSAEFGWRLTDTTGSQPMQKTLVDMRDGGRLLEQTLEVRSLNHAGLLFDSLSFAGFGYGGDPNTAVRVRIDKDHWYTVTGSFRRNHNFWDYDLFANPLNPPTSKPAVPVNSSPHSFDVARRMEDVRLTLLPQSRARFRLGYSRNVMEGPATTTVHQSDRVGAEFLLFLPWSTKQETYQAGADFKFLPRTSISYDQFFERLRDGATATDRSFAYQLPNGVPYDLGLTFDTLNFQPCSKPIQNPATTPPTASSVCAGATAYSKSSRYHATYPTEQLSFESSYFRDLDLSGRLSYSTAQMRLPAYSDLFAGYIPFSSQVQATGTGTARARRTSVNGDLGLTWAAGEHLQFSDFAHYVRFRVPGVGDLTESSLFATTAVGTPNTFATCKPPFTAATCPAHIANSPPDLSQLVLGGFLAQTLASNQAEARYDISRRVGARVGYRYEQRDIAAGSVALANELFYPTLPNRLDCAGVKPQADGSCQVTTTTNLFGAPIISALIHQHSLLAGLWATPWQALRLNVDFEGSNADQTFSRIDPRRSTQIRARASYRPRPWAEFSATANRADTSNGELNIDAASHHRAWSVNAALSPRKSFTLQAGYNYVNDRSHDLICYTTQTGTGLPCPGNPGFLLVKSFYGESLHFGNVALRWKPVKRVTAAASYDISRSVGSALLLNALAVSGPVDSLWHRPSASLAFDVTHRLTWRGSWGYYGYDENGAIGPTLSRDFNTTVGTLSLRYAF